MGTMSCSEAMQRLNHRWQIWPHIVITFRFLNKDRMFIDWGVISYFIPKCNISLRKEEVCFKMSPLTLMSSTIGADFIGLLWCDWNPPVPSLTHYHQERRLADLLGLQAGVAVVPAGLAAAAGTGLPPVAAERPGPLAVPPSLTLVWQQTGTVGNWTKWWGDRDCSDCPPFRRGQTEEWGGQADINQEQRHPPPTLWWVWAALWARDCCNPTVQVHTIKCIILTAF